MSVLANDPALFATDAMVGFVDVYAGVVTAVPGGVVRSTPVRPGKVAVIVGGGSGHYPAFAGLVGPGFADGAVVGNVFTSPSTADVESVVRNAVSDSGALVLTGNYAGDVMNFSLAVANLSREGIDARYFAVTDDIASAPRGKEDLRRGIAGDLIVFKAAAAAAEEGQPIDAVEAVATRANLLTRTIGVAFDGCTLPGAGAPLFTVPEGRMGIGVGIHGEPGIGEVDLPTATELAGILVDRILEEAPIQGSARAAVVLNGLGRTKYEELFVLWADVAPLLRAAGITIVAPEVGELVTSLDMSGCSLTLTWLDDELERLWRASAAAPAFHRGSVAEVVGPEARSVVSAKHTSPAAKPATVAGPQAQEVAAYAVRAIEAAADAVRSAEVELGRLDAVAGDGDHGRGMVRGLAAASEAAMSAARAGCGVDDVLAQAGAAWAAKAGGTSGVLWGAMIAAAGRSWPDEPQTWRSWDENPTAIVAAAVDSAVVAAQDLGKAKQGDKTMLDALIPLRDALRECAASGVSLAEAWPAAAAEAARAAEATASLLPQLGRARPLAAKSVGSPDPGAVSLSLIAQSLATTRIAEEKKGYENA
jgi:D-erythrulose 4-kinase